MIPESRVTQLQVESLKIRVEARESRVKSCESSVENLELFLCLFFLFSVLMFEEYSPINRCGLEVAFPVHRRTAAAVLRPSRRAYGERLCPSQSSLRGASSCLFRGPEVPEILIFASSSRGVTWPNFPEDGSLPATRNSRRYPRNVLQIWRLSGKNARSNFRENWGPVRIEIS